MDSRGDIRNWLPKLSKSGLLTPDTHLLTKQAAESAAKFMTRVRESCSLISYPVVIRSAMGLPKHQWSNCVAREPGEVSSRICSVLSWAHSLNLPTDMVAVRQYVPLASYITCRRYGGLTIAREFRLFWLDGQPACLHPIWPAQAVIDGDPVEVDWHDRLLDMQDLTAVEKKVLASLGLLAATSLNAGESPADWAFDWAATVDGRWCLIDCGVADATWHWPGCENAQDSELPRKYFPTEMGTINPDDKNDWSAALLLNQSLDGQVSVPVETIRTPPGLIAEEPE